MPIGLLVAFVLFAMFAGCCDYVLCNVCVAVSLVMSWSLRSLSVLSFAYLSDLVVPVALLVVFV